jgi:hypothetical protein
MSIAITIAQRITQFRVMCNEELDRSMAAFESIHRFSREINGQPTKFSYIG